MTSTRQAALLPLLYHVLNRFFSGFILNIFHRLIDDRYRCTPAQMIVLDAIQMTPRYLVLGRMPSPLAFYQIPAPKGPDALAPRVPAD